MKKSLYKAISAKHECPQKATKLESRMGPRDESVPKYSVGKEVE